MVHGSDGLDEITTTGPTLVFEIRDSQVERGTVHPQDFGVPVAPAAALKGGDTDFNTAIAREVLAGCPGPRRDIVLINASAGLVAAGRAQTFREAMALAAVSIDSGAARGKVEALAHFTPV